MARASGREREERMKKLTAALVCAFLSLALAAAAGAATIIGVNEDQPKFADDNGAAIYGQLQDVGMKLNVISMRWDPATPTTIENQDRLAKAIVAAQARGLKVILAVYPAKAR